MLKKTKSLSTLKGRREHGLFAVERTKIVSEFLKMPAYADNLEYVVATPKWYESETLRFNIDNDRHFKASPSEMERMSSLSTAADIIAVFRPPAIHDDIPNIEGTKLYIALDRIQDPGNLGTIIRLADWFGVDTILTSHESADSFNPKTIMASMGSVARVNVVPCNLAETLTTARRNNIPVWGTFMSGESIYELPQTTAPVGILVMGNEGSGISPEITHCLSHRISIPAFPPGHTGAESLNVAMATSIILAEFRRRALLTYPNKDYGQN